MSNKEIIEILVKYLEKDLKESKNLKKDKDTKKTINKQSDLDKVYKNFKILQFEGINY
jgi:hypothetical protein